MTRALQSILFQNPGLVAWYSSSSSRTTLPLSNIGLSGEDTIFCLVIAELVCKVNISCKASLHYRNTVRGTKDSKSQIQIFGVFPVWYLCSEIFSLLMFSIRPISRPPPCGLYPYGRATPFALLDKHHTHSRWLILEESTLSCH